MTVDTLPDRSDLLEQPEVKELISHEESLAPKLQAAAKILEENHPGEDPGRLLSGLLKIARGLQEDRLSVFVSYKKTEAPMAQAVLSELRERAGTKMEFSWSEEYPPGEDWRQKISRSIRKANWFLLLLPDPAAEWDWCLYEAGLFRAGMLPGDRLICLHHPDISRPDQISDVQTVEATGEAIEEFLRFVFLQENPMPGMAPINPHIEKRIPEVAQTIVGAINPPAGRRRHFDHFVLVEPPQSEGSLAESRILESDLETAKLFGRIDVPDTWGGLVSRLPKGPAASRWISELEAATVLASKGEWFDPVQATFRASRSGKVYRPHLHAMDVMSNGAVKSLQVIFVEDLSPLPPEQSGMPRDIASLTTSLRLAYRFRWEIIEEFGNRDDLDEHDLKALEETLERIEAEAETRGLMDPEALAGVFSEERAQWIGQMYETWAKYRNPQGTGELDAAMKAGDRTSLRSILGALQQMNQEYMMIASQRFADWAAEQDSGPPREQAPEVVMGADDATPATPAVESPQPADEPVSARAEVPEPASETPAVEVVVDEATPVEAKVSSKWANIAIVLGLCSFVPGVGALAALVGLVAVRDVRRHSNKVGMGRAVVGLVLGVLASLVWLVAIS